ncbi:MAG: substrate-binding domain-containing protein [Pseudomonadota bacterium]
MFKTTLSALAVAAIALPAAARDEIRIVGSSTVFPFSTAVAEQFGQTTDFPTPVVESTGSGGGMKLFCAGVGTEHPDITNASRRMKTSEFQLCQDNGVTDITESVIGFDGIVVANALNAPQFELTREQLSVALIKGAGEPAMWSDVDPSLPAIKIEVLGPPPSSGTRDAFEEIVLEDYADDNGLELEIRTDGAWIDAGENDNLMVSKLAENPNAVAVFGYSFLDQNSDQIKGANIEGVEPTFENIASGDYPVSRSLYYYIKQAHVGVVPGIQEYGNEFASEAAAGNDGYLIPKGLIPLPAEAFKMNKESIANLKPLTAEDFN